MAVDAFAGGGGEVEGCEAVVKGGAEGLEDDEAEGGEGEEAGYSGDGVVDAVGGAGVLLRTEVMTTVVRGATLMAMPMPRTLMAGKRSSSRGRGRALCRMCFRVRFRF